MNSTPTQDDAISNVGPTRQGGYRGALLAVAMLATLIPSSLAQQNLRQCPHGQRVNQCPICFGGGGSAGDADCASAKAALLAKLAENERQGFGDHVGGHSRKDLAGFSCSYLEMLASLYTDWKSRSELQRDAYWAARQAEDREREAERHAEERERETKKQQNELLEQQLETLTKQLKASNEDLQKKLDDPDFIPDKQSVLNALAQKRALLAKLNGIKDEISLGGPFWEAASAHSEADTSVDLLEDLLKKADHPRLSVPTNPRLPTGTASWGETIDEYGRVFQKRQQDVGVLEQYVTGPAKQAVTRLGEDMKPILNSRPGALVDPVGPLSNERTPSGYRPPSAGTAPRSSAFHQPMPTAPKPAPYQNPLAEFADALGGSSQTGKNPLAGFEGFVSPAGGVGTAAGSTTTRNPLAGLISGSEGQGASSAPANPLAGLLDSANVETVGDLLDSFQRNVPADEPLMSLDGEVRNPYGKPANSSSFHTQIAVFGMNMTAGQNRELVQAIENHTSAGWSAVYNRPPLGSGGHKSPPLLDGGAAAIEKWKEFSGDQSPSLNASSAPLEKMIRANIAAGMPTRLLGYSEGAINIKNTLNKIGMDVGRDALKGVSVLTMGGAASENGWPITQVHHLYHANDGVSKVVGVGTIRPGPGGSTEWIGNTTVHSGPDYTPHIKEYMWTTPGKTVIQPE